MTSIRTFNIDGEMTFEQATTVFDSIDLAAISEDEIVINLAAVDESDSAALAIMLEWVNQAQKTGKSVSYTHVPKQLMHLIEMTNLQKILKLEPVT